MDLPAALWGPAPVGMRRIRARALALLSYDSAVALAIYRERQEGAGERAPGPPADADGIPTETVDWRSFLGRPGRLMGP